MRRIRKFIALAYMSLHATQPALQKIDEIRCRLPGVTLFRWSVVHCRRPLVELLKPLADLDGKVLKAVLADSTGVTINVPTALTTVEALAPTISAGPI